MNKKHTSWVEPGRKTLKGTSYRAKCDCGWKYFRELPFLEAGKIADIHAELMKDPEKYRSKS